MKNNPTPRLLRLLTLFLLLLTAGRASAQAPGWQWATSPGAGSGFSTATDTAGNTYIAGYFSDTATFGATTLRSRGLDDGFVAKLTRGGTYEWVVQIGGAGSDDTFEIALDRAGNVYVTGGFSDTLIFGVTTLTSLGFSDVFIGKLSPAGAWQWAVAAPGIRVENGAGLAMDAAGNAYVIGDFSSPTLTFGATTLVNSSGGGPRDVFAAKLSSTGVWQWAVSAEGASTDHGLGIAADSNGNTYLTGDFASPTITFGSTVLTDTAFGAARFLAKLDATGAWQWAIRTETGYNGAVAVDSAGSVYLVGTFEGSAVVFGNTTLTARGAQDVFVGKLSPAGAWLWAVSAGGGDVDIAFGLTVSRNGDLYVTGFYRGGATFGSTQLTSTGNSDAFVAKLTAAGVWQWCMDAGGVGATTYSWASAADQSGDVVVTGSFYGAPVSFGPTTLPLASGSFTSFIARLSPPPTGLPAEASFPTFTLAPNPAHSAATLTGLAPGTAVTLLDGVGRMVRLEKADPAGTTSLDVRGLPAGFYVVRAGSTARRLVVE